MMRKSSIIYLLCHIAESLIV